MVAIVAFRLDEVIFKWRKGFLASVTYAQAAKDFNSKLTPNELKKIAQAFVNKDTSIKLTGDAAAALTHVKGLDKVAWKKAAKKVVPGLVFFTFIAAAKEGYAGNIPSNDSGLSGMVMAAYREVMLADLVESVVFPAAEAMSDAVMVLITGHKTIEGATESRYQNHVLGGNKDLQKAFGGRKD